MNTRMADEGGVLLAGRYRLQTCIGQGGMASVYGALDEQLGRDVAVKIFLADGKNQKTLDAQEAEMKLLASLNHHGIVTLLDAGVDLVDSQLPRIYLVMEVAHGADLQQRLSQGQLSARQIALMGGDLAEGLEYIHQHQIVHRDVKPANILIIEDAGNSSRLRAKLADFGIAMLLENARVAANGVTLGTAAYLSPEQVLGYPLGAPSDIYSLGLVLLECFTGKVAYPGQPQESALARLVKDPAVPEQITPGWQELLRAMTTREPRGRPPIRDVILTLRQAAVAEMAKHKAVESPALRGPEKLDAPEHEETWAH